MNLVILSRALPCNVSFPFSIFFLSSRHSFSFSFSPISFLYFLISHALPFSFFIFPLLSLSPPLAHSIALYHALFCLSFFNAKLFFLGPFSCPSPSLFLISPSFFNSQSIDIVSLCTGLLNVRLSLSSPFPLLCPSPSSFPIYRSRQ